eukprot:360102-Chlamydomonas_euryale.AAC.14
MLAIVVHTMEKFLGGHVDLPCTSCPHFQPQPHLSTHALPSPPTADASPTRRLDRMQRLNCSASSHPGRGWS